MDQSRRKRLHPDDAAELSRLAQEPGVNKKALARQFGVTPATVRHYAAPERAKRQSGMEVERQRRARSTLEGRAQEACRERPLLPVEWVLEKLRAGTCEQTGILLDLESTRGPWTPEIDRIDPKGLYVPENCQLVCRMYNMAKLCWTDADVWRMIESAKSAVRRDYLFVS